MFRFRNDDANRWQYEKIQKNNEEDCDRTVSQRDARSSDDTGIVPHVGHHSLSLGSHQATGLSRPFVLILVSTNVLLSIALLWVSLGLAKCSPVNSGTGVQLMGQADIPVEMELYQFQTGVAEKTPFWGAPNTSTDAAWSTILNAGLVKITTEQASRLSAPTARSQHDPRFYVGILEVFHQLHCLNILRTRLYSHDEATQFADAFHTAHCFDYIRQSIMCLSDVNIAPISWNKKRREYEIRWDAVRQCRNFEKIHQWAVDEEHHENEEV